MECSMLRALARPWVRAHRSVRPPRESPRWTAQQNGSLHVTVIGLIAVGLVAFAMVQAITGGLNHRVHPCRLRAEAVVVMRHRDDDLLGVKNRDADDWQDAQVTIVGLERFATGQILAARYRQSKEVMRLGDYTFFRLNEFTQSNGEQWAPVTMTVDTVELQGRLGARLCMAHVTPRIIRLP